MSVATTVGAGHDLLHGLVEAQVDRTPDAVAVVCEERELTYAELDGWANRLAHRLVAAGAGAEVAVAIVAERSIETVVSILAVLKAGACYLPVDPGYPPARFHTLMNDAGSSLLVTSRALLGTVPEGEWRTVLADADALVDEPRDRPDVPVDRDAAAYIIYTSGSTGEPKGVVVPHRQICATTRALSSYGRPDPACFLLLISFSFDACGVGLYWTLTSGGQVVVPTRAEHRDPRVLRELVARHRVTHLDCTPSLYSVLLADDATPLRSLHVAIVGGEACPPELVQRHSRMLPACWLINNYGPTEASVWTTSAVLAGPTSTETEGSLLEGIPIGAGYAGSSTIVLDEDDTPAGEGVPGELAIGGAGVARGYHARPALTAERFVPDPFADEPGARMYRTGDLVRRRPDGQLVFEGRVDDQVKVRGFRIELGEVEAALRSHPAVTEAVALVQRVGEVDTLVAWVAAPDVAGLDPADVVAHAAQRVPEHVVPTQLVVLDVLPRNVAGKVDRHQLPRPPAPTQAPGSGDLLDGVRAEISELVQAVLGVRGLGAQESFFDHGATSLHLAQLALELLSRYDVMIPIHLLFEQPTVVAVAHGIGAARRDVVDGAERRSVQEMLDEVALPDDVRPEGLPVSRWEDPRTALVLGATGYLGGFVVRELLRRSDTHVVCLVRGTDEESARQRVVDSLRNYRAWEETYADRVRVVLGDITQPHLGLADADWEALARDVDQIFHAAGIVNFVYPYSRLKQANVDSVVEALRLATTTTLKAAHFVSSIDVFLHTGMERPFTETDLIVPEEAPQGYARSKWAADRLVGLAQRRGIPASNYRAGMMMSESESGATQTTDYLVLQVKTLLAFGEAPDMDYVFDAIPVDYAASVIVNASLNRRWLGRNFHLWNLDPVHVSTIYDWIRSYGYELEPVTMDETVTNLMSVGTDSPLYPLLPLLFEDGGQDAMPAFAPDVVAATDLREELATTLASLAGSDIEPPPMTEALTHRCFGFMESIGFLPSPDEQRRALRRTVPAGVSR